MANPLISIVLCTWNGEAFIKEQVDSILDQNYRPIELIISDDASTDGTKNILKRYESNPEIRISFHDERKGLAENFHFASKQANGEFIAFSDQDDVWMNNKLEKLYNNIGEGLLIYSNSLLVDENGRSLNKTTADVRRMYSGDDSRGYVMHSVVWGHGMLIRRSLLQRSLPMPEGIHHDDWLAFKALSLGGIKYFDEVLTHYRQHGSSSTKTIAVSQPRRKHEQRFRDFEKKLWWIQLMMENEREEMKPFYQELFSLYSKKDKGRFVWSLFFFMLKNRKALFQFSNKSFFSQLIEIAKQSRGEVPA